MRLIRTALAAGLLAACSTPPQRAEGGGAPPADTLPASAPTAVPGPTAAESAAVRRVVYVPVYSHIYHRDQHRFIDLAITLSIRNTDPEHPVTLTAAHYYDTRGRRVRSYVRHPARLGPMATVEFVVENRDREGGSGANFLVELTAARNATEPVVEAVMVGGSGPLSVSFLSTGRVLQRP